MSASSAVEEPIVVPKRNREADEQSKTRPKKQPPYAVIIHNDDLHTFPYVIDILRRVCGHSPQKAYELTAQIHFSGQSAVWTGTMEVAELKRDQIRGFGSDHYASATVRFPLGVTIEPLPSD